MDSQKLQSLITEIVSSAQALKDAHTDALKAPVNYACIFAQSEPEYGEIEQVLFETGERVKETPTGFVYKIAPLQTSAGLLQLLKLRKPDPSRPERGDADFTVSDYPSFKSKYLGQPGFSLIERPEMEMIELVDGAFDVRAYFSHPTLAEVIK